MDETVTELWAERVCHAVDLLRAEIGEVRVGQQHLGQLLEAHLGGVTQFKLLAGLAG